MTVEQYLAEIIFHLKVIQVFLACISGCLGAFFIMVALKYKGIL